MPRFAANLSFLYTELAFLDRFEAAARDGFEAVEYLFPYAWPAQELAARLRAHGLKQVLFNAPAGGGDAASIAGAWDSGSRGLACLVGREAEFRQGMALALDYAKVLQCPRIHVMAGLVAPDAEPYAAQAVYHSNLRWAAAQAHEQGVEVLIEPINSRDMPGYFLTRQQQAHDIVQQLSAPNLKVQMDLYHCQIMEGDLATRLRTYLPSGRVGHLQIAGVPERHEPDTGEVHYPFLFELLDALDYSGWVGCEYRPAGATSEGLTWLKAYL